MKRSQTERAGKRCWGSAEGGALLGAGGPHSAACPGQPCVLPAFPALQPGTGILTSGQAEGSFSELQPGLARWKCRPRLGGGGGQRGSDGSQINSGLQTLDRPPRWGARGRMARLAGLGGGHTKSNSCRTVRAPRSLPLALIPFQSPPRFQVRISSLRTRLDWEGSAKDGPPKLNSRFGKRLDPTQGCGGSRSRVGPSGPASEADSQAASLTTPSGFGRGGDGSPPQPACNKRTRGWRPPRALASATGRGDNRIPRPGRGRRQLGAGGGELDAV